MRQFFVKHQKNNKFYLQEKDLLHFNKVLKGKIGDEIICVFNGLGFLTIVTQINKNIVECEIIKKITKSENKLKINIYFPITKQNTWDWVIEKISELNATKIIPVWFSYCQKNQYLNYERLKKIAISAAQQANRFDLLEINEPIQFKQMINELSNYDLIFLADERLIMNENTNLFDNLKIKTNYNLAGIIGPTGGFTKQEFEDLKEYVISIKLGSLILRAETAAIVLIAYINWYYQNK